MGDSDRRVSTPGSGQQGDFTSTQNKKVTKQKETNKLKKTSSQNSQITKRTNRQRAFTTLQ